MPLSFLARWVSDKPFTYSVVTIPMIVDPKKQGLGEDLVGMTVQVRRNNGVDKAKIEQVGDYAALDDRAYALNQGAATDRMNLGKRTSKAKVLPGFVVDKPNKKPRKIKEPKGTPKQAGGGGMGIAAKKITKKAMRVAARNEKIDNILSPSATTTSTPPVLPPTNFHTPTRGSFPLHRVRNPHGIPSSTYVPNMDLTGSDNYSSEHELGQNHYYEPSLLQMLGPPPPHALPVHLEGSSQMKSMNQSIQVTHLDSLNNQTTQGRPFQIGYENRRQETVTSSPITRSLDPSNPDEDYISKAKYLEVLEQLKKTEAERDELKNKPSNMVTIAPGCEIDKHLLSIAERDAKMEPSKFALNLLPHFFTEKELLSGTVTGTVPNANKKRNNKESLGALDQLKIHGILDHSLTIDPLWAKEPDVERHDAQFIRSWRKNRALIRQMVQHSLSDRLWRMRNPRKTIRKDTNEDKED